MADENQTYNDVLKERPSLEILETLESYPKENKKSPLEKLADISLPPSFGGDGGEGGDGGGGSGGPYGHLCPLEAPDIFVKAYSALDSRYSSLVASVNKSVASAKKEAKRLYDGGYTSLNGKGKYFVNLGNKLERTLRGIRHLNLKIANEQSSVISETTLLEKIAPVGFVRLSEDYMIGKQEKKVKQMQEFLHVRMSYLAAREVINKYELFVEEREALCRNIGKPKKFVTMIGKDYETVVS